MRAAGIFTLLSLVPLLAGCAKPGDPGDQATEPNGELASVPFEVFRMNATTGVGNAANSIRIGSNNTPPIETAGLGFKTTRNATAVLFELAWDDPYQDLDAYLSADVRHCPWNDIVVNEICYDWALVGYDTSFQFGTWSNSDGNPGMGDSPSRILAEGTDLSDVLEVCSDPCNWMAYAWAKTTAVELSWNAYLTVFYGPIPEGYTALPGGSA